MSSSDDSSKGGKTPKYMKIKSSKKFATWKSLTLANAASAGLDKYFLRTQEVLSEDEIDELNVVYININARTDPQASELAKNEWEREKNI